MAKSEEYRLIGRPGAEQACCPNHGGSHKVEDFAASTRQI